MNKKLLFILGLLTILALAIGCGGGGGGGSVEGPPGTDVGIPSIVKLVPSKVVAQTGSGIVLRVRVLDGNGLPVPNYPVSFENMSFIGTLSAPSANTNSEGIAEVTIGSFTEGFASIFVSVNTGSGQIRDAKTVFFTSSISMNLFPTLELDVDGDGDGIYNEASDLILFENANDRQVNIRATVRNSFGQLVPGVTVIFGSDFPYKIGGLETCSDGTSTCEVEFPLGNTATTDFNGRAFVIMQVNPETLRSLTAVLNITADADNGAFNMTSLFLNPVTVSSVVVGAAPTRVASGGSSTINATVTTNLGTPVPDGTTVNFTSSGGTVATPFAQTTDGKATTSVAGPTLTAGSSDVTVSVTASSGGVSGSTSFVVTAPAGNTTDRRICFRLIRGDAALANVNGVAGAKQTYTITGGTTPYTVTYSCTNVATVICNSTDADCLDPTDTSFWNTVFVHLK